MIKSVKVSDLNLHREPTLEEAERKAARLTLALLAERHKALDELPELLAMLGISA